MNKKITKLIVALALLAFLFPMTGWGQTYTKVTTAPADWSGTYVIIADDSEKIFTGQSGSNNYGGHADVTISSGSVTGNYSDYEVLVEKSGTSYTMKHVSSGKYLGWNTGNNLHFSTDEPTTDAFKWNLSTSSILNASDNARKLQYNSSSPRFACYTSSQKVAYLYLKESVSPTTVATTTTIDDSDITNTDVYTSTAAGSLTATVTETESGDAVSGATVTWTSSKENVATIDEDGVVTLVAAGTTTITASYAGVSGEFGASSATYELTVTSTAPYVQPTEFEIGLNNALFGTSYNGTAAGIDDNSPVVGTQDNVTVTYAGSGSHYVNDAQIRFYPNNKLTFEAPEGYEIKEIVFTADGQWNATISADGGTYDSDTKTWTGSATSVLFTGSGSGHCRMSKAAITLGLPSSDPIINASNVNIAYDATSGEIAYTITNPVPGTLLQATADADWVSNIEVGAEAITFTTTANELKTVRVATFTLTYEGAEDKTVTVSQAGNPNIIDKIENISESGVPYNVQGTVVATSARAFVIGDGTGFIYTYLGSAPSWSVGDMVKISGTTSSYNQLIQFPNTATVEEATESEYTPLTPAAMTEVPDYTSGLYKSDYYQFEGMLTKEGNYYVVAVGEGQIRISYPSTSQTTELDALLNKMVKVNGFFAGNSANGSGVFTAIMESIEEVVSNEPSITLASYEVEVNANAHTTPTTIAVTYANIDLENDVPEVVFYEQDGSTETTYGWLFVDLDPDWNVYYIIDEENTNNAARTAYFKVLGYDSNGNNVYSDLASITQAAAPAVAYYDYSINGVVGTEIHEAAVGTPVTLETGEDLDANFTFAGWTTDPNVVEPLYTQYTFNANEVVTFYAVYAHTNSGATQSEASYVKVTSDLGTNWAGNYLIAYSDEVFADGRIGGKDDDGSIGKANTSVDLSESIADNAILATVGDTYYVTLEEISTGSNTYVLKTQDGRYNYQTANSNGLAVSNNKETAAAYPITVTFNSADDIDLGLGGNANGAVFHYNTSASMFRYYKDGGQSEVYLYKYTEPTQDYYTRVFLDETVADDITIVGPSIIPNGQTLDMGIYTLTNNTTANLIIEDGGQLITDDVVEGTIKKHITPYDPTLVGQGVSNGWYFISYPLNCDYAGDAPTEVTNMIANPATNYDLYKLVDNTWANYKQNEGETNIDPSFTLYTGHGYLYANANDVTLEFAGSLNYFGDEFSSLEIGWNLVGNPYTYSAYPSMPYYKMNEDGTAIESVESTGAITPCTGILVYNDEEDGPNEITYSKTAPTQNAVNHGNVQMVLAQTLTTRGESGSKTLDNAIVNFNEGIQLPKFYFGTQNANIYIPQGNKEYAIVNTEAQGETPVNFKAAENGTYTLTVNAENVEMNYLHLIDNMTGMDIDLLATPSYTFNATTSDYESRFRLVFASNGMNAGDSESSFAFFSDGNLIVSNEGQATLQVVDIQGRLVGNETINGSASLKLDATAGVYVIRLINNDNVKTQKVVVR